MKTGKRAKKDKRLEKGEREASKSKNLGKGRGLKIRKVLHRKRGRMRNR